MRLRPRLALAIAALVVLLPGLVVVIAHMPRFGDHALPYGDAVNRSGVPERHVTNMVTAVNFDYRAFDTLGEELILLGAVSGTLVLLRGRRGENVNDEPARAPGRRIPQGSEAVGLACRLLAPIVVVFGIYVALHAQLTPGGGFQGGAIAASGMVMVYLGEGYRRWRTLVPSHLYDAVEALGGLLFVAAGIGPLVAGAALFENVLPLGRTRSLLSGGLILVENAAVTLAVASGFLLLFLEFLEETRSADDPAAAPGGDGPEQGEAARP